VTSLEEAAAGLFPVRRLTAAEAEDAAHGRRIAPSAGDPAGVPAGPHGDPAAGVPAGTHGDPAGGPAGRAVVPGGPAGEDPVTAGFAPDGRLVALLADRGHAGARTAKPVLVFLPGERFPADGREDR
jgi:tRNA pseudouridine55 synthase